MTKEEKKAQRKADKAMLKSMAFQLLGAYSMEPDLGKWTAIRIAAEKLVELATARERPSS